MVLVQIVLVLNQNHIFFNQYHYVSVAIDSSTILSVSKGLSYFHKLRNSKIVVLKYSMNDMLVLFFQSIEFTNESKNDFRLI